MKSLKKWLKGEESNPGLDKKDDPQADRSKPTTTAHIGPNPFRFGLGEPVFEDNDPQIE